MSEHTKGPWTQDGARVRTTRGIIAICPTPQNGGVFDCQDNARLIAVAPKLLAIAIRMVKQADDLARSVGLDRIYEADDSLIADARAAIAKAEARTSGGGGG